MEVVVGEVEVELLDAVVGDGDGEVGDDFLDEIVFILEIQYLAMFGEEPSGLFLVLNEVVVHDRQQFFYLHF
jgi:hypothetical protein